MLKFFEWNSQQNEFELVKTAKIERQYREFFQRLNCQNCLIGLCFGKSAKLAVLMKSVIDSENAFCWLDPNADVQFTKNRCLKMRVKYIISERLLNWPLPNEWSHDTETQLWSVLLPFADSLDIFGSKFAYSICTSGSTGNPKTVHVPHSAIEPNVQDFILRFNLHAESKLMWSTSLNFDPSFLELLLAFAVDCSFYIVDEVDFKKIWRFSSMVSKVRPNFLHINPAVLSLFSNQFLFELFGPESPVQHLLVGGDTFPTAFILRYVQNPSVQIYNVYGLTEVSCWASCTRFDPSNDTVADASDAIQETQLIFGQNGILIEGRECVVNGEKKMICETGDQFVCFEEKDGRSKYVVTSREKLHGAVVSREVEEFLISNFNFVDTARLVLYAEQLFVFIKRFDNNNDEVEVPESFNIKEIFYIDEFPLTENGKINDTALRKHIENDQKLRKFSGTVFQFLRFNPALQHSNETIASLGFSSRDLFEFIFEIGHQQQLDDPQKMENLRRQLFNAETLASILFDLINGCCVNGGTDLEMEVDKNFIDLQFAGKLKSCKIELKRKLAMKKCVDFSPEVCDNLIFAGDMSGYFAIFNMETSQILLENQHENAVITKPLIHSGFVVYCTVDGQVHWVNLSTFQPNSATVGDSIRAEPCIFGPNQILVSTFSSHLILLDLLNGLHEQVCQLDDGQIRNPALIINEFVVFATIDGTLAGFRTRNLAKFRWRRRLHKSIFASLFQLPSNDEFGALSLDGDLHFIKAENGQITRTLNFNVSCSIQPTIFNNSILIPCGKDTIKVLRNVDEENIDEKTYKLPGFFHQSRLVYLSVLKMPLLKCTNQEDSTCKIFALDFEKEIALTVLELDAPSFGDPLIVTQNTNEELLILGARDNNVHLFNLFVDQ